MSHPADLEESSLIARINNNDKILRTLAKKLIEYKYTESEETRASLKNELQELIFLYRFQLVRTQVQLHNLENDDRFYQTAIDSSSDLIRKQSGRFGGRCEDSRKESGHRPDQNRQS